MNNVRFLRSNPVTLPARFGSVLAVCVLNGWLFSHAALASDSIWNPEDIFGSPDEAYETLIEEKMRDKLDEYLGVAVAVAGFLLVVKSMSS